MSAMNPQEPDPSLLDALAHYAPIGAAASIMRCLLSDEKTSKGFVVRRTIAASITAWLLGPAIESNCPSQGAALAAIGAVSYAAPEVWDWIGKKAVSLVKAVFKA